MVLLAPPIVEGVESILGFRRQEDSFTLNPCIPFDWSGFSIAVRLGATRYEITVENPQTRSRGVVRIELDGVALEEGRVPLVDDGVTHLVRVVMGEPAAQPTLPTRGETITR